MKPKLQIARFSILDRDQSAPRGLYALSGDALSELRTLNEGRTDGQFFELWRDGKLYLSKEGHIL